LINFKNEITFLKIWFVNVLVLKNPACEVWTIRETAAQVVAKPRPAEHGR
jgi:hypothetical protein